MRAILLTRYGAPDVLDLGTVPIPTVDDDPEGVLIRVRASSVNALDWHRLRGEPFPVRLSDGLRRPKQPWLGTDVAGVVEAVGPAVTDLAVGDEVFGVATGAFADVARGRVSDLVRLPTGVTFEQAAAVPVAATTALQALRDRGRVEPGQRVLIHGAGGGVGTFAVQLAASFGAHVTAVSGPRNQDLLRSIGAHEVLDYARQDFTQLPERYDLIVDIAGTRSLPKTRRALERNGSYVMVGAPSGRWIRPMQRFVQVAVLDRMVSQRMTGFIASISRDDLQLLQGLLEQGAIRPVIDRTYPLGEVPEAIRHVEARRASGKVVITM
jgi:NADPH:quinone reductase-like Zn-dependent oxidoreductase